jgi:2-oxoglutarate ferredoxin oxidoreductase subunit alpha
MQGDVLFCAYNSHGDTKHPCLYPSDIAEAYLFAQNALDLAERYQTCVFVLSDLDLGMNLWMSDPLPYPEGALDRGKVLDQEALAGLADWGRYKDVDGDGIPYRTLPGTPGGKGAYFTRGSGHDEHARYTESGEVYRQNMDRLRRKIDGSAAHLPGPISEGEGNPIGILAYGTSHHAVQEARDQLRAEEGIETDYLRVRAFPFAAEVRDWILGHERVYVVEQNRDGQMRGVLAMEFPDVAARLRSVLHYDGLPIDARSVTESFLAQERTAKPAQRGAR